MGAEFFDELVSFQAEFLHRPGGRLFQAHHGLCTCDFVLVRQAGDLGNFSIHGIERGAQFDALMA